MIVDRNTCPNPRAFFGLESRDEVHEEGMALAVERQEKMELGTIDSSPSLSQPRRTHRRS